MAIISWFNGALALFLAAVLAFAGQAKLTPALTPEMYQDLSKAAVGWARVYAPYFQIAPAQFKQYIGVAELISAAGLILGGFLPFLRKTSAIVATVIMVGALFAHYNLKETDKFIGPAVLGATALLTYLTTFPQRAADKSKKS